MSRPRSHSAEAGAGGEHRLLVVDQGALLFIGRLGIVPPHRCAATVVAFGLDRPFELTTPAGAATGRVLAAAPGVVRSVDGFGGRMAVCLVDPAVDIGTLPDERASLSALSAMGPSSVASAWPQFLQLLRRPRPPRADERVAAVADTLRHTSADVVALEALARRVGLSPSRLAHLFKAQFGIPMRAFRTWCRFSNAVQALASGGDLTAAAQAAGFFDQAHFTKTFRAWFGIPPSFIFSPGLSIHVCRAA